MTPVLVALVGGLLVGGIVGVWVGGAGRVWWKIFAQWASEAQR